MPTSEFWRAVSRWLHRKSGLLAELFGLIGPSDGFDPYGGEMVLQLRNGKELRSGWHDRHDPDARPAGDYILLVDAAHKEIFYAEVADLVDANGSKFREALLQVFCLGAGGVSQGYLRGKEKEERKS